MKKTPLVLAILMLAVLVSGFDNEISYLGIQINLSNGTYNVTTKIFDASAGGNLLYNETREADVESGYFGTFTNYTLSDKSATFYIEAEIDGENYTRFKYTPAAQCIYSDIWEGYDVASDLNDAITLDCGNITGATSNLCTITDTSGGNSTEQIQDAVWDSGIGTTTRITVTYQDGSNDVDFVVDDMNDDQPDDDSEVPDTLTIDASSSVHWTALNNYPSACGTNETLTALGDTLTCSNINITEDQISDFGSYVTVGTKLGNTTQEIVDAVNNTPVNGSAFIGILCSNIVFDSGIGSAGICDGDDAAGAGSYDLNISADTSNGTITDSEVFTISGGQRITTSVSTNTVTITALGNTSEEIEDTIAAMFIDGDGANLTYIDESDAFQVNFDCSDVAGVGLTCTDESFAVDLGTAIDTTEITDSTILEADLKVVDAASDEDILTYETTTGDFEWHTCAEITGSADLCDGGDADTQYTNASIELNRTTVSENVDIGNYNMTADGYYMTDGQNICMGNSGCGDSLISFNGTTLIIKVN